MRTLVNLFDVWVNVIVEDPDEYLDYSQDLGI